MRKAITTLDFLGYQPLMFYRGSTRYKSFLGGVISLLTALLSILATLVFGLDIVNKENPTILMNREFYDNNQIILNNSVFTMSVAVFLDDGVTVEELERYLEIYIIHSTVNGQDWNVQTYNFISCKDAMTYEHNIYNFTNFLYGHPKSYFCFENNFNKSISGIYSSSKMNYIQLRVDMCKNSTKNSNGCKSELDIREKFKKMFVHLIYTDTYNTDKDYQYPVKNYLNGMLLQGSSYTSRRDTLIFKQIDYQTDIGIFLTHFLELNSFQMESLNQEASPDFNTTNFYNIILATSHFKDTYYRSYIKLQNVAAQVGGVFNFLITVFTVFRLYYDKYGFVEHLNMEFHENNFNNIIKKYNNRRVTFENTNINLLKLNNHNNSNLNELNKVEIIKRPDLSNKNVILFPEKKDMYNYNWKKSRLIERIFRVCKYKVKTDMNISNKLLENYIQNYSVENFMNLNWKLKLLFDSTFNYNETKLMEMVINFEFFQNSTDSGIVSSLSESELKIEDVFMLEEKGKFKMSDKLRIFLLGHNIQ